MRMICYPREAQAQEYRLGFKEAEHRGQSPALAFSLSRQADGASEFGGTQPSSQAAQWVRSGGLPCILLHTAMRLMCQEFPYFMPHHLLGGCFPGNEEGSTHLGIFLLTLKNEDFPSVGPLEDTMGGNLHCDDWI